MILKILVILKALVLLGIPFQSAAKANDLNLSYGQPTKAQNKTISSIDLIYKRSFWTTEDNSWRAGLSGKVGNLTIDDESATKLGGGIFGSYQIGRFWLEVPIGVLWIDKSVFGENLRATKDYGGKLQFTYGIETGFYITSSVGLFYRFEHMSNGDQYEYNPALNSHNLGIRWAF
ncbi:MAG: acyloxyacyl hydrolase [Shewanella sp.]